MKVEGAFAVRADEAAGVAWSVAWEEDEEDDEAHDGDDGGDGDDYEV